jgi:16S rRNA U1498 N3-methylase RsmE
MEDAALFTEAGTMLDKCLNLGSCGLWPTHTGRSEVNFNSDRMAQKARSSRGNSEEAARLHPV